MVVKMTLADRYDNFMNTWIRKTSEEKRTAKVENITEIDEQGIEEKDEKFSMSIDGKKLTPEMRRRMALTAPFYMKGLRKKCRDSFRAGFTFKNPKTKDLPPEDEMKVLDEFNKRNNIYKFLSLMKQDAHIYGDGITLILFVDDQNTKKPDLSLALGKKAKPHELKRIDPERITGYEYKNKYWKEKRVKHLVYEKKNSGFFSKQGKIFIHPDRLLLFKETDFAFSKFGISDIDMLRHVISSNADIDIATGDILKWWSYGIVQWTKDGADRNTMKAMRKIAEKHPHTFIGNEDYKLQVHNLVAIDPKPFYDYLIMAISAVLVMPTHVLKGLEIGETTGAEAGYVDYNKDIKDSQNLVYKPNLDKLYKMLYKSEFINKEGIQYRKFDYEIEFNTIYVGEYAEAEIDAKRSATAVNMKTAGIIDNEESRMYINEGHIHLDPKKTIKNDDINFKNPTEPNPRTEQSIPKKEKEDKSDDNKLKATDSLTRLWDNKDDDKWNDYGKREEAAQEKRVRQAAIEKLKKLRKKTEMKDNE
jgi:hypothetical protein